MDVDERRTSVCHFRQGRQVVIPVLAKNVPAVALLPDLEPLRSRRSQCVSPEPSPFAKVINRIRTAVFNRFQIVCVGHQINSCSVISRVSFAS